VVLRTRGIGVGNTRAARFLLPVSYAAYLRTEGRDTSQIFRIPFPMTAILPHISGFKIYLQFCYEIRTRAA
jgi:hypothetical protein